MPTVLQGAADSKTAKAGGSRTMTQPEKLYVQLFDAPQHSVVAYVTDPREVHDNSKLVYVYVPVEQLAAAQAQIEHFESPDGEGNCRFCGQPKTAAQGESQLCYCIPTIRLYRQENEELRKQ